LGVTVAFELRGELMGTIRAVPMCHGLTLAEKLLHQALPDAGAMLDDSWEMGRLVIDPDFRSGPESLKRCLFLALSFLHGKARVAHLHAACTPALSRLYRRFGFAIVAQDVPLHGTAKTYTLIHGPFTRVIGALSSWDTSPDMPLMASHRSLSATPTNQGTFA
jgi:predicted GNAT family N-acyltransferase